MAMRAQPRHQRISLLMGGAHQIAIQVDGIGLGGSFANRTHRVRRTVAGIVVRIVSQRQARNVAAEALDGIPVAAAQG